MNLKFPLTSEKIREEMKRIIHEIHEETNWEILRDLSKVTIELGDTPDFFSSFGVVREESRLIFGSWVNELTPNYYKSNLWEFLLVRESLTFFITPELLLDERYFLTKYLINVIALCKLKQLYVDREFSIKFTIIKARFLSPKENLNGKDRELEKKLFALVHNVINHNISYKLIFESYFHFRDEFSDSDFDQEEILDHLYRYLTYNSEEFIAPIHLKGITLQVLQKIVELGFDATGVSLAEKLNLDNSMISRELNRIANRYNAKFWLEKNFYKLGLHYYSIIIRLIKKSEQQISLIIDELSAIKYIGELYQGQDANTTYVYSFMLCPHIVADILDNKLLKYRKNNIIDSYEVKPLRNRLFMTNIVEEKFTSTIENYQKLINNEIPSTRIITWSNDFFSEEVPYNFQKNEINLLRLISIYLNHSLINPQLYRCHSSQLMNLLADNNIDINIMDDFLSFMNKLRNNLIEKNLISFRLHLTTSNLTIDDILIIKVICNPEDEKVKELVNKIAIFSWTAFNITYDSIIIRILGLKNDHKIATLITELIKSYNFEFEKFNIKNILWRHIPYDELYYFEGNKWAIK